MAYSKAANERWNKTNQQRYTIAFMRRTEADLIEKLESVPNRAGYIKALIRRDLAENQLHDPGDTAAPADLPNVAPADAKVEKTREKLMEAVEIASEEELRLLYAFVLGLTG